MIVRRATIAIPCFYTLCALTLWSEWSGADRSWPLPLFGALTIAAAVALALGTWHRPAPERTGRPRPHAAAAAPVPATVDAAHSVMTDDGGSLGQEICA